MIKQSSIYDRIFGLLALICWIIMFVGLYNYGYKEGKYIYLCDWLPCLIETLIAVSIFFLISYNLLLIFGVKVPLLGMLGTTLILLTTILLKFTTSVVQPGSVNNISFISGLIFFALSLTWFSETN